MLEGVTLAVLNNWKKERIIIWASF